MLGLGPLAKDQALIEKDRIISKQQIEIKELNARIEKYHNVSWWERLKKIFG